MQHDNERDQNEGHYWNERNTRASRPQQPRHIVAMSAIYVAAKTVKETEKTLGVEFQPITIASLLKDIIVVGIPEEASVRLDISYLLKDLAELAQIFELTNPNAEYLIEILGLFQDQLSRQRSVVNPLGRGRQIQRW